MITASSLSLLEPKHMLMVVGDRDRGTNAVCDEARVEGL